MTNDRPRSTPPTLLLALVILAAAPAARAAEQQAPAEPMAATAAVTSAATPAEPVAPADPKAVPVMPTTVVTPPSGEGDAPRTATAPAQARPPQASPATRPGAPRYRAVDLGADPKPRWRGFPISLSLRDAPLPEVLRSFARMAGMNLVLDPRVQGTVTVELKDVPWDQALYVILKSQGLAVEIDGRVWLVQP